MGWLFSQQTKQDLVNEIVRDPRCRRHSLRGNTLWTVDEVQGKLVIGCHLLRAEGGRYGVKSMDAACHPYYYDCPLGFLDLAPESGQMWQEWAAKVRQCHAAKRRKQQIKLGDEVQLVPGCRVNGVVVERATVTGLNPMIATAGGQVFRVNPRHLA